MSMSLSNDFLHYISIFLLHFPHCIVSCYTHLTIHCITYILHCIARHPCYITLHCIHVAAAARSRCCLVSGRAHARFVLQSAAYIQSASIWSANQIERVTPMMCSPLRVQTQCFIAATAASADGTERGKFTTWLEGGFKWISGAQ